MKTYGLKKLSEASFLSSFLRELDEFYNSGCYRCDFSPLLMRDNKLGYNVKFYYNKARYWDESIKDFYDVDEKYIKDKFYTVDDIFDIMEVGGVPEKRCEKFRANAIKLYREKKLKTF